MATHWVEDTSLVWESQLIRYHGVGALFLLIWDTAITFSDEVQYIWPQNRRSPTKWVYLFTRYFGLLAQARLASINLTLDLGVFSAEVCRMLYCTQVLFGGTLMACIQALLMLRVYALYIRDRRIAFAMISLLTAEVGSMPGIIYMTIPTAVGNVCMKPITIRDIALFGASVILPQLIVLGLTVGKFLANLRAGWGKIPIVSRLVRDDFILVFVIVGWVIVTASLTSMSNVYGYAGYYWLLSLLPAVGCRVVINMQRIADESGSQRRRQPLDRGETPSNYSTPQFTSIVTDALDTVSLSITDYNCSPSTRLSRTDSSSPDPVRLVHRARSHCHVDACSCNGSDCTSHA